MAARLDLNRVNVRTITNISMDAFATAAVRVRYTFRAERS
jgi:hypothetical protein